MDIAGEGKDHVTSGNGHKLQPMCGYRNCATFGLQSSKSLRSFTNSLFFDGPSKSNQTSFVEMRTYFLV